MATFEEIFGTIRSLLHAPSCLIAETLVTHMNKLAALDEQRCIDEVCSYVEQALQHRPIPRTDLEFTQGDRMMWQNNIPSLFNNTVYWPSEEEDLALFIPDASHHTFELNIEDDDVQSITTLLNKPWRNQIWGLCFFNTVTIEQLEVMAKQPPWPHLTQLTLFRNIQRSVLKHLTSMPMLQHIHTLNLYPEMEQEVWTDEHTECLNTLQHLHTLLIENESAQDISLKALANHPNLTNMQSLSCKYIADVETLFQTPTPRLHRLRLVGCLDAEQFTGITRNIQAPKLEELSLVSNNIPPKTQSTIKSLLTPVLSKILLNHNNLDHSIIDTLGQSKALGTLEHIAMSHCSLDTEKAIHLFESLSGTYNHLILHNNDIHTRALKSLANNDAIESLQHLYIPYNPLCAGVGAVLSNARWLNTLNTLVLNETQLDDPMFGAFLTHPALSELNHVMLYDNELADDFCHELTQRTPAWHNIRLYLNNNQIGPEGLKHLANWPGLRHINMLDLSNNTFDATSLRALGESPYVAAIPYLHLGPLSKVHQQVVKNATHFNDQTKKRAMQYTV